MKKKQLSDNPGSNDPIRYSDEDLADFKNIIGEKLKTAIKELQFLENKVANELVNDKDFSKEQVDQMIVRQKTFIEHLNKALDRIENKTYGICAITGKLIDKARLRAVPHATLSMEAKKGPIAPPPVDVTSSKKIRNNAMSATKPEHEEEDPEIVELDSEMKTTDITVDGWNYNKFGVCLNSEVVLSHGSKNHLTYKLTISKNNKGWCYGYNFSCNSSLTNTGSSLGGNSLHSEGFKSKEESMLAGGEFIMGGFTKYLKEVPQLKEREKDLIPLQNFITDLKEKLSKAPQVEPLSEESSHASSPQIRACRVCGCTDNDCRQCIEKTGSPCHWVEDDLCSACVVIEPEKVKEIEKKEETVPTITTPASFFTIIYPLLDGIDINLKLKRINGRLTVSVFPETASVVKPATLTGTPEELDEGFFSVISKPVTDAKGLKVDLENYNRSIADSKKENKPVTPKADETKAAVKKQVTKKAVAVKPAGKKKSALKPPEKKPVKNEVKKAEPKKADAKKTESKISKPAAPDMFAGL